MPSFIETEGVTFKEVTAVKFDEMLNVLPPILWNGGAFLVGEPNDHRKCRVSKVVRPTFDGYFELDGKYYTASTDLTVPEYNAITGADLRAALARASKVN